ncbi:MULTISPECIES: restriction endonuclease [unclassified Coleofasciculus]|uniref:restriction endonuclease n=1 Tax=Cyanophyceae TaxID=3028117 RepID=UPI001686541B|nr:MULTISPECIES: restriction endonuclease [unclassified Coleofasciculus]MBD1877853.1 restriction endonuclease [Coleofasciculus sp. FACHB-T130]MBD1889167.1 restriction endonuclease [Coleofasciculus sp. FACHB-SPT9]MBD2539655.1 restriction endonuclease [Coleofasciculus sp. FACHB-SPT36]
MKIVQEVSLISVGSFEESSDWSIIRAEIRDAVSLIVHPPGTSSFTINPTKHGNGVKPIKQACTIALRDRYGWRLETSINYATRSPGKVDATKVIDNHLFALEWETGNISSSHRAVNKMVLGLLRGVFLGTVLVLPSRKLYPYLTDRIGNYEELEPYFDVWRAVRIEEGFLAIFVIEHDRVDNNVPTITKGTDGRALV